MGLGLLGRGIGDAKYLASCGAKLIVTDLKTKEQLASSVEELEGFPDIQFVLGEHRLEDFRDRDLILKAAGVPLDSIYVAEAKKNGIPMRMSADLFAELAQIPVIGITGTRGKSTTTALIHAILKEAGRPVLLGGNVRGVSNLELLKEATPAHTAVLELDSWQCQGFGEALMSPHIAVFTTFFPDHLNYYKDNLDTYLADKANIFLNQTEEDTLVLGKQCAPLVIEKYGERIESRVKVVGAVDLPDTWIPKIPGEHNRYNAALALAAARAYSIDDAVSRRALEAFTGLPGRLEFIREIRGVKVYNDNNSTTPEATIAALRALGDSEKRNIVLIMGGDDKKLDMSALVAEVPRWCAKVVLFKERGTDTVRDEIFALKEEGIEVYEEDGLSATVERAFLAAVPGETILYSPAFSSFGKYFKNEYDRNDQFVALAKDFKY